MMQSPPPGQDGDLLRQALAAAQRGEIARATDLAEQGLREGQGDPLAFNAFLGMIHARAGNSGQAAGHLFQAHRAKPADVTIACNLIAVLMEAEREGEALDVASRELAFADSSLRVARYRAFLAQSLDRFEPAAEAYEFILERVPDDFECWNNLGNARAGLDDLEGAVSALQRAVELDNTAAPARLNLAAAYISLGRNEDAEATLTKAAHDFPQDPRPSYQLYVLRKTLQRQDAAIAALEEAALRDPASADYQLKLGAEYGVSRRTREAEAAYQRAIGLDPAQVDAYLGLAIQYEHSNREEEFAPLVTLARANGIGEGPLAFIETLELRRLGQFEAALARLEAVPPDVEPIRTIHIRATLLERLRRSDAAFAAYSEVNSLMAEGPTEPLARAAELRAGLTAEMAMLSPEWRDSWQAAEVRDGHADPVFLVGFPRSGTTLLDTILMGHPRTVVMEEQPPLNLVEEELGGLAAIPGLDAAAIASARTRYFAEAAKVQPVGEGQVLIDKSPLFLYRLPLIQRLFPDARIILALRHPCDVVLSCFMSNFRLNSAMANFLRLEDAADFYDLCFSHWQKSLGLFPARVHEIVYERLVDDVEGEVRPLLDWLGLEWNADMLDHRRTAKSRGLITTASYSQVTEPIYQRASGRWLRYRAHLEPVLGKLERWAERLGYDDLREQ